MQDTGDGVPNDPELRTAAECACTTDLFYMSSEPHSDTAEDIIFEEWIWERSRNGEKGVG